MKYLPAIVVPIRGSRMGNSAAPSMKHDVLSFGNRSWHLGQIFMRAETALYESHASQRKRSQHGKGSRRSLENTDARRSSASVRELVAEIIPFSPSGPLDRRYRRERPLGVARDARDGAGRENVFSMLLLEV